MSKCLELEYDITLDKRNIENGYTLSSHIGFIEDLITNATRGNIQYLLIKRSIGNKENPKVSIIIGTNFNWLFTFQQTIYNIYASKTCTYAACDKFFAQDIERIKYYKETEEPALYYNISNSGDITTIKVHDLPSKEKKLRDTKSFGLDITLENKVIVSLSECLDINDDKAIRLFQKK